MVEFELLSEDQIDERLLVVVQQGTGHLKTRPVPDTHIDVHPRIDWEEQLALRQNPNLLAKLRCDSRPTFSRFTQAGVLSQVHIDFGIEIAQALIPHRNVWLAHLVVEHITDGTESFWVPPSPHDLMTA